MKDLIKIIKEGGVVVIPSDTLYGIHAAALNKEAVEKAYEIKGRSNHKPFIILISDLKDLEKFEVQTTKNQKEFLKKHWPGKLSVVLPVNDEKFGYLHRGTKTLAFRLPDKEDLVHLIKEVGPLISTTANPEGWFPSKTIKKAKEYFGDKIDYYEDAGVIESDPSTLTMFKGEEIEVLRQGAVDVGKIRG